MFLLSLGSIYLLTGDSDLPPTKPRTTTKYLLKNLKGQKPKTKNQKENSPQTTAKNHAKTHLPTTHTPLFKAPRPLHRAAGGLKLFATVAVLALASSLRGSTKTRADIGGSSSSLPQRKPKKRSGTKRKGKRGDEDGRRYGMGVLKGFEVVGGCCERNENMGRREVLFLDSKWLG